MKTSELIDEILSAAKEVGYDWVFPSMPLEKLERFAAAIRKLGE